MLFNCGDAVHDFYHVEPQAPCLMDIDGRMNADYIVRCASDPETARFVRPPDPENARFVRPPDPKTARFVRPPDPGGAGLFGATERMVMQIKSGLFGATERMGMQIKADGNVTTLAAV